MKASQLAKHISEGYIVLGGNGTASLVMRPDRSQVDVDHPSIPVPYDLFELCVGRPGANSKDGLIGVPLGEITEFRNNGKIGWREMLLPPPRKGQAYYLFIQ
jgi:hypothetical protein